MSLTNYTTKVPVSRSITLIQQMLAQTGATAMMLDYENKEPSAVSFRMKYSLGYHVAYKLPCNWRGVLCVMNADPRISGKLKTSEHAKRVAWRTIHDWLRAQLALVAVGSASMDQVMLSYALTVTGETLYERLGKQKFEMLALPPSSGS